MQAGDKCECVFFSTTCLETELVADFNRTANESKNRMWRISISMEQKERYLVTDHSRCQKNLLFYRIVGRPYQFPSVNYA